MSRPDRDISAAPLPPGASLPDAVFLAAILALPGVGPRRLDQLLEHHQPGEAWAVERRCHPGVSGDEPERLAARHVAAGVALIARHDPAYPQALLTDVHAPHLLFSRGDPAVARSPMVAMVGTRRCSDAGRALAAAWAQDLADCGVGVVSGLALGIDAAAHRGALASSGDGAVVGVVGSGLDVVYPQANRALWEEVAGRGCLLSECPLGTRPEPWRFPARNRIIAGLADVTVVVESHERGGALVTAEQAADRGRTVLAVPGSLRFGVSRGTNRLIADGAGIALDVADVLTALELSGGSATLPRLARDDRTERFGRSGHQTTAETPPVPGRGTEEHRVWALCEDELTTVDAVVARSGLSLDRTCLLLDRLERRGLIRREGGGFVRCGPT